MIDLFPSPVRKTIVMIGIGFLLTGSAFGQTTAEMSDDLFPSIFGNSRSKCYIRRYDKSHMQTHARQSVSWIRIDRVLVFHNGRESWEASPNQILIRVRFKNRGRRIFTGSATCRDEADHRTLLCRSSDCDSRPFHVRREGKKIAVILDDGGSFCLDEYTSEAPVEISIRDERKEMTFLLEPLPLSFCHSVILATEEGYSRDE